MFICYDMAPLLSVHPGNNLASVYTETCITPLFLIATTNKKSLKIHQLLGKCQIVAYLFNRTVKMNKLELYQCIEWSFKDTEGYPYVIKQ